MQLIQNYNQMSPDTFTQLILKNIPTNYHDRIQECLTDIELLKYVQQLAYIWSHFFRIKIEEDYWNYVDNVNTSAITCLSEDISKGVIRQSSMNWDPRTMETTIQCRKTSVQNKLKQMEYYLLKHMCEMSSKFDLKNKIHIKHSIDIIFKTFGIILQNDLNPMHVNFEQRKLLLYFTVRDAHLVKSFYDLNPTEKQVRISFTPKSLVLCKIFFFFFYSRSILFNNFGEQN